MVCQKIFMAWPVYDEKETRRRMVEQSKIRKMNQIKKLNKILWNRIKVG